MWGSIGVEGFLQVQDGGVKDGQEIGILFWLGEYRTVRGFRV